MNKIEVQKVPVSHGWLWSQRGYRLIMRGPLQAISLAMVFVLGIFLAMIIPAIGIFLAILIMPVLMAGYMRVCRALEYSEKVVQRFMIAGFENRTTQLASLGGMLLIGMILISMATAAMGGAALTTILESFRANPDTTVLINALLAPESGLRLMLLMSFTLFFVLMMAMQFAPMLVFFNQMSPRDALLVSLKASVRNIVPFSVYSLIIQLIAFVASAIPFDLGLFILLPIMLTSMYVAYRDIFSEVKIETTDAVEPAIAE